MLHYTQKEKSVLVRIQRVVLGLFVYSEELSCKNDPTPELFLQLSDYKGGEDKHLHCFFLV